MKQIKSNLEYIQSLVGRHSTGASAFGEVLRDVRHLPWTKQAAVLMDLRKCLNTRDGWQVREKNEVGHQLYHHFYADMVDAIPLASRVSYRRAP